MMSRMISSCSCTQTQAQLPPCGQGPLCRISRSASPGLEDESFLGRKDHKFFNSRCGACNWSPRYDDPFWNCRYGAPVYTTRFDTPSPVKPPWCPPGCKTRSYFYPRYYKPNRDGWYRDQCHKVTYHVKNPCGTNSSGTGTDFCRKWSIPLCPCPLAGRSRGFPSPKACGCCPSPACVPKRLRLSSCQIPENSQCDSSPPPPPKTCEPPTALKPCNVPLKPCYCYQSASISPEDISTNSQPIKVIAVIDEKSWIRIQNSLQDKFHGAAEYNNNDENFESHDEIRDGETRPCNNCDSPCAPPAHCQCCHWNPNASSRSLPSTVKRSLEFPAGTGNYGEQSRCNCCNQDDDYMLNSCNHKPVLIRHQSHEKFEKGCERINNFLTRSCLLKSCRDGKMARKIKSLDQCCGELMVGVGARKGSCCWR